MKPRYPPITHGLLSAVTIGYVDEYDVNLLFRPNKRTISMSVRFGEGSGNVWRGMDPYSWREAILRKKSVMEKSPIGTNGMKGMPTDEQMDRIDAVLRCFGPAHGLDFEKGEKT